MSQQLQRTTNNIKDLVASPAYQNRFKELLKDRAPQFVASIVQLVNATPQLQTCEPNSIIAAAVIAAALDLPIEKSLGFAYIVPYGSEAQFQIGYKGLIQLAIRSGQYSRINATPVFDGELDFHDKLTSDIRLDPAKKKSDKIVGYCAYFRMVTGFEHAVYWDHATVEAHAKRYSKAYASTKFDSPWKTNFEKMALKTVIRDLLSHWGILSVQMHKALIDDQTVRAHVDAEATYPDMLTDAPKAPEFAPASPATAKKKEAIKKHKPEENNPPQPSIGDPPTAPTTPIENPPEPAPTAPQTATVVDAPIEKLRDYLFEKDIDIKQVTGFCASKRGLLVDGAKEPYDLDSIRPDKIPNILQHLQSGSEIGRTIMNWGKEGITP